jgi:hypothetical protein
MSGSLNRGNKLYEGSRMMLPEHIELLKQHQMKAKEYPAPQLDPEYLSYINYIIQQAYVQRIPLVVTYATKYKAKQFCGYIDNIDLSRHIFQFSFESKRIQINVNQLISIDWT